MQWIFIFLSDNERNRSNIDDCSEVLHAQYSYLAPQAETIAEDSLIPWKKKDIYLPLLMLSSMINLVSAYMKLPSILSKLNYINKIDQHAYAFYMARHRGGRETTRSQNKAMIGQLGL